MSNIQPNNSPTQHLNPLLTYVASLQDDFKHHSRATSNAKHPTPETLRTCDANVCGELERQLIASNCLNPNACPNARSPCSMLLRVAAQDTLMESHTLAIPNPDDGEPTVARADWKWLEDERVRIPPE